MSPKWQAYRIRVPAAYINNNIYRSINNTISKKLLHCNNIEEVLAQGWIEEVPKTSRDIARVFRIYLKDRISYADIPVLFYLKKDNELLV